MIWGTPWYPLNIGHLQMNPDFPKTTVVKVEKKDKITTPAVEMGQNLLLPYLGDNHPLSSYFMVPIPEV